MSLEVAALVPGDVAIFVVAIVCQNADINMSGLGVNHSGTIGDCAITSGDSDCDGDVLWLCQHRGGEAAEQVSYNADINICMLVNRFCAVGGCAITGGCAGGDSDCDGDVLWLCWRWGGETAAWVSCLVIMF